MKTVLALVLFVFVCRGLAAAQLRESDEDRLKLFEPPAVIKAENPSPAVVAVAARDRELKYVAGADGKWFSEDDQLYHYFVVEHDAGGSVIKRTCFKPDNSVQDSQEYSYGRGGAISRETSFDGQGNKLYDAVYQYDSRGRKTRVIRYNPAGQEIWSMNFEYGPKGLLVKDFEYKGSQLEKWHAFEYDKKKRMVRAREYKTLEGPVFAAKEFFYNPDGSKSKEHKYTGPGPDGVWFTPDDVMQYYTVFEYGKAS